MLRINPPNTARDEYGRAEYHIGKQSIQRQVMAAFISV